MQVGGLTRVIAISAGGSHTVALRYDGTVWTWGSNGSGQLGNGTKTGRSTPGIVGGLSGVEAISAGSGHTVALKSDGTVWTWGSNNYGQLGDGTGNYTSRATPYQIPGFSGVTAIAAGFGHTVALKGDGTVWVWGNNDSRIDTWGIGVGRYSATPARIQGITGATAIAAGEGMTVALRSDGTVWTWGYEGYEVLGQPVPTNTSAPLQVPGLVKSQW